MTRITLLRQAIFFFLCILSLPNVAFAQFTPPTNSPIDQSQHPRIFLTNSELPAIRGKIENHYSQDFQIFLDHMDDLYATAAGAGDFADWNDIFGGMRAYAFLGLIDPATISGASADHNANDYTQKAIEMALYVAANLPDDWTEPHESARNMTTGKGGLASLALQVVYDWTYASSSANDRTQIVDRLITMWDNKYDSDKVKLENHYAANVHVYGAALCFYGDSGLTQAQQDKAQLMMDSFVDVFETRQLAVAERIFAGSSDWVEGDQYMFDGFSGILLLAAAAGSALDIDYFSGNAWIRHTPEFLYFNIMPKPYQGQHFFRQQNTSTVAFVNQRYASSVMNILAAELVDSNPDLAGLAAWFCETSQYGVLVDGYSSYKSHIYDVFYKFLFGTRQVPQKSPNAANVPLSMQLGQMHAMRSEHVSDDATLIQFFTPTYWYHNGHNEEEQGGFTLHRFGPLAVSASNTKNAGDGIPRVTSGKGFSQNNVFAIGNDNRLDVEMDAPGDEADSPEWFELGADAHIGTVDAYEHVAGEFDYINYDYSRSYKGGTKTSLARRELLYLRGQVNEEFVVVLDRVDSNLEKHFILHTAGDQEAIGDSWASDGAGKWVTTARSISLENRIDQAHGKMFLTSVFPNDVSLHKFGGPGYEWVWPDGEPLNYDPSDFSDKATYLLSDHTLQIRSQGNQFLTVMQIGDANTLTQADNVAALSGTGWKGTFLAEKNVVLFSENETLLQTATYTISSTQSVRHVLCEFEKNASFTVTRDGQTIASGNTGPNGVVFFSDAPGGQAEYHVSTDGGGVLTSPDAPTNLNASAVSSTQIALAWQDNADNESGFKIERHAGDNNFVEVASVGQNVTSFTDVSLTPGTSYTYRVLAYNSAGESGFSNESSATTDAPPPPPDAPSNLAAAANGSTEIDLSWNDNANDEDGFKIERHAGDGNFAEVAQLGANVTSFNDAGLDGGVTYTYRIFAFNFSGNSGFSNEVSATTDAPPPPPATPTGLVATTFSSSSIGLDWNDNSSNETGFRIERHSGDGNFAEIVQVGPGATSYDDLGLSAAVTYTYRVFAFNGSGDSNPSNEASATTDDPPAGDCTEGNLSQGASATASTSEDGAPTESIDGNFDTYWRSGETQSGTAEWLSVDLGQLTPIDSLHVAWRDKNYARSYEVQVSETGSMWNVILSMSKSDDEPDDLQFESVSARHVRLYLLESNKAHYKIDEFEVYGCSDNGGGATAPATPSGLSATPTANQRIELSWNDNSSNESGFKIERREESQSFVQIAQVAANVTSYSDAGVSENVAYTYRVRATNNEGDSGYSNEASATISSSQNLVRGPYLQMGAPTSMTIRWRTDQATNSRVEFGLSAGNLNMTVDSLSSRTEHVVVLSGLSPNTTYYYSIGSTGSIFVSGGDYFFKTNPTDGTRQTSRIWIIGDSGEGNQNAINVRDAYKTHTGSTHTNLWVMLGDNAYDDGTDAEYQTAMFDMYPEMLRKSVVWPAFGNHDGASADSPDESGVFYDIFSLPRNAESGGVASGTEAYYSFNYANIHFVCLNSHDIPRGVDDPMLTWLEGDLAANTLDWVVAFWHHPPYSKGSHDSDLEDHETEMRENALPILENYGVDLVFTGHSHSYERSYLLDGHYGNSLSLLPEHKLDDGDGREDSDGAYSKPVLGPSSHDGAVYVVAGNASKTSSAPLDHPAMYYSVQALGSIVLDVDGGKADVTYIDDTGAVRDYFTIQKGGGASNPPQAPTALSATANGSSEIDLSWTDNSNDEDGFKIERHDGDGNFAEIAQVGAGDTSYNDAGLSGGTTYSYRVRAFNNAGNSSYSNEAAATTEPVTAPPADPDNLAATANSSAEIDLSWNDNSNDETGFKIERHDGDGNFAEIAQVGTGVTSYDDTGLNSGTTYTYRVRAFNGAGNSGYSNETSATTDAPPPADPSNLTATANGASQIDLNWDDNSNDETGFKIERHDGDGNFAEIAQVGAGAASYDDTGLNSGTTYTYRVRAFNGAGNSGYSNEASATTDNTGGGDPNVNLALNQPTTASTTDKDASPDDATDGDENSFWESRSAQEGVPEWLQVDLGGSETINRAVIAWRAKSYAASFEVQVSNDQTAWSTVVSATRSDEGTDDFTFPEVSARYVRVLMLEKKKSTFQVEEFEVYGGGPGGLVAKPVDRGGVAKPEIAPNVFSLHQNYPNPFNPETRIQFSLPQNAHVKITVYTLLGKAVAVIADAPFQRGSHSITFNAGRLPSGIYLYRMDAGSFSDMKRMILMR